jgi:succinate dehydrogenase hydrophobic anchor subunit
MNKSNWFWPDVSNLEEAKKACRVAMWCAIVVAGVTTLFSVLAISGAKMKGIPVDGSALIDAALFAGIAFGLSRYSRFAGVAGFVLFLFERIYMMAKSASPFSGLIFGVFLLLGFLHGMRGAFAYHKQQTQTAVPLTSPPFA